MVRRCTCCLGAFFGLFFRGKLAVSFRECIYATAVSDLLRFFHPSFPNPGFDTFPESSSGFLFLFWHFWPGKTFNYKNSDGRCDVTFYAESKSRLWLGVIRKNESASSCGFLSLKMSCHPGGRKPAFWEHDAPIVFQGLPYISIYQFWVVLSSTLKRGLKWWSHPPVFTGDMNFAKPHQGVCSLPIQAASFSVAVDLAEAEPKKVEQW